MLHFLARRIVSALSVVLVTLVATFALFFVAPTDPAGAICGQRNCPQERYLEIKKNLNLDKPKVTQFADYMKGIAKVRGHVKILLDLDRVLGVDGTIAMPQSSAA